MFSTLKTAALSVMLGAASLGALPAAAQAEGVYLNFGGRGAQFGVETGNNDRYRHGPRRWDRHNRECTPERALDKAERMGIWRARVVDVSRRTITVRGRQYGDRVSMTFARAPRCPIVG